MTVEGYLLETIDGIGRAGDSVSVDQEGDDFIVRNALGESIVLTPISLGHYVECDYCKDYDCWYDDEVWDGDE